MTPEWAGALAAVVAGTLACGLLARVWFCYSRPARRAGPKPAAEVDLSRYQSLSRLTSADDLEFLRSRPGYKRAAGTRFLRERRRILRLYLRELALDFSSLHAAARRLLLDAPEEHADLVAVLLRQRAAFYLRLSGIEVRLFLASFGTRMPDVGHLVAGLANLQTASTPAAVRHTL